MSDLEFVTTSDIIEELMSRETFLGIIIKSVNEITTYGKDMEIGPKQIGGFEIRCKNMSPAQAQDLLHAISASIDDEMTDENWKDLG